jgi:3-dehydroquinate synthase
MRKMPEQPVKTLTVNLQNRSYPIYIGHGLLERRDLFNRHVASSQAMVVTNETVAPLYLDYVLKNLVGKRVETVILPDGESYKTLESAARIFDALIEHKFGRDACLVALGGGVIGDLAGFAAACYQRGIPFVQVPTTLLAQVDSSVGGKTGVNHPRGKNMIGAFHQPACVIADVDTLATLPDRELRAGLAEVIKYGLISDFEFFHWLEQNMEALRMRDAEALAFAIERSCSNKADVVAEDEHESGLRAILNLGHTFGHAIETGTGYGTYLHGEAVAIGCCQAADLSRRLHWLSEDDVERIVALFKRAGLPVVPPRDLSTQQYLDLMAVDKKKVGGELRLIILERIGKACLPLSIDHKALTATLNEYGKN